MASDPDPEERVADTPVEVPPTSGLSRDAAFRRWVEPELDVMLRVALRLTGDPHEVEDLVQDSVLRAYRALDRFDGRYPRAWLLTIVRNTNINRVRKRREVPGLAGDVAARPIPGRGADARDGAGEEALARIPDQLVVDAVNALSPKLKPVVVLVDIEDLTYREAAEVLDVPVGTIMSRLHRGRARVRDHLAAHGHVRGGRA